MGHHTIAIAEAPYVGEVESAKRFHLAISLPLTHQDELKQLLKDLYDPHSPIYRHFLKPNEFANRFGPTPEDAQAVADYMTAKGLTVTKIHPNRVIVDVEGNNEAIQKAFHVKLHYYQRPDGSTFYGPDDDPSLDLETPILNISGIDNFTLPPPPLTKKLAPDSFPPPPGSGPFGYNAGIDLRNAYAANVTLTGAGQTIAFCGLSNYKSTDITTFQAGTVTINAQSASMYSTFGPVSNVYLDGITSSTTPTTDGYADEAELDIECADMMAPAASKVFYIGINGDDILNQIATDNIAKQINGSWEGPAASGAAFSEFSAQGQSYFNAAGDWYSYLSTQNIYNPNNNLTWTVNYPFVTLVGGTNLTMSNTTYDGETVWNEGSFYYVTGGGILTHMTIPSYQQSVNMSGNGGSTSNRNAPDVAACAENISIYNTLTQSGWGWGGGTSAATPLWTGFMALVNQQAAIDGFSSGIGFINPAIYAIGQNPAKYANDFHDITSGNNDDSDGVGYNAEVGFDLCTGWGSPNGQSLINDLVASVVPATSTASATTTNTPTATPTSTATNTATATCTRTGTNTASVTSTNTPTNSATNTSTPVSTSTATNTATVTCTETATNTATITSTYTVTATPTDTPTVTSTSTETNTDTITCTETMTNTATVTSTYTVTNTPTETATVTCTFTPTNTATITCTETMTNTATVTSTYTPTNTVTYTATVTSTSSATNTPTITATVTETFSNTNTPSFTLTSTTTGTPTFTATYSPTFSSVVVIAQVFPNPSTGSPISINVQVPIQSTVTVDIFTLAFRKIHTQTGKVYGPQTFIWDLKDLSGTQVSNGVYFVRVQIAGKLSTTKILKVLVLR